MSCIVFLAVWADEAEQILPSLRAEGATVVVVPAMKLAQTVNCTLPGQFEMIAVVNGVTLTEGWLKVAEAELDGYLALSPWLSQEDDGSRAWWEPVYPNAFIVKSLALDAIGGLDERLVFHHHRTIAQRFPVDLCTSTSSFTATPVVNAEREKVIGDLYYRHLEDDRVLREESGAIVGLRSSDKGESVSGAGR